MVPRERERVAAEVPRREEIIADFRGAGVQRIASLGLRATANTKRKHGRNV
jgi:hypothetical protein